MTRCAASPLGGGQCELEAGHDGKHRRRMWRYMSDGSREPGSWFEWDDESQKRLADKLGSSRFD